MKITGEITYTRKKQIGVGQGMNSTVYLADDPQLGGEIAVKEIEKSRLKNDPARFFQEAKAMNDVGHPNIVPIRCAFQTNTLICIAMSYYCNGSLADRTLLGPIMLKDIHRVGQGILNGVGSIHIAGYLHFDIKPSNILFDDNGRPLIADFGQTRQLDPTGIARVPSMYIAGVPPESYRGIGVVQSDIYQVGLVLYRAANGDEFFNCQIPKTAAGDIDDTALQSLTQSGKFPDRKRFMPHVPKSLRRVIRKALQVDPGDRFRTAIELADALGKISVTHDWKTTLCPNDEITWESSRASKPNIVIKLVRSSRAWATEIYSRNAGALRRRTVDKWRNQLTRTQALEYLKQLFEELE